jgi:eukaryotic-like serine/threonine-protein kinase
VTAVVVAGRYRLMERVGVGRSEVWSAHDLELDRDIALKLLAPDADRVRFEREAQSVARLSHPHICLLYDYGEASGRPYMVLELLLGGSLDDWLREGRPLADFETARIAAELASALGYAHAEGVLHRDIKPTNVLFDLERTVKLADFGIARVIDAPTLTEAGTILGTAAYISPEQSRGEPVTPATDVYAFGAVLYQMLTGRPPFEGTDWLEVAAMHATHEPPPISSLRPDAPPDLVNVAERALAKQARDRPVDGNALVAMLREPSRTAVETETQVLAPRRRRRIGIREVTIGGALALLAALGTGAALLVTPEQSQAPVTTGTTQRAATRPATTSEAVVTTAPSTASRTTTTTARTTAPVEPPPPSTRVRTSTQTPATAPATTATQPTTDVTTTAPTTATTETTTTTTPEQTTTQGRAVANVLAEEAFWHGLRWMRLAGIEPAERSRQAC